MRELSLTSDLYFHYVLLHAYEIVCELFASPVSNMSNAGIEKRGSAATVKVSSCGVTCGGMSLPKRSLATARIINTT
jgi:hypothetical protein